MYRLLLLLSAFGWCAAASAAESVIQIRLSIKVIRNPVTGADPPGLAAVDIPATVAGMNELMDRFGRGYRFVIVDPIARVGGANQQSRPRPSFYYDEGFITDPVSRNEMEQDALSNPGLYAWNPAAINIYINDATNGPLCDSPNSQVIVIGDGAADEPGVLLHDLGHYFGLCNTQGCDCGCCRSTGPCSASEPGSDGISDTLTDSLCWGIDDIARWNFDTAFGDLTSAQSQAVSAAMSNVMGFGGGVDGEACRRGSNSSQNYLSEGQLDRWCDIAATNRNTVCDGRVLFVRRGANVIGRDGRSDYPYGSVAEGVGAASPGDIVMVAGNVYPERLTITRPVTLRAPRDQVVRIGG